jgi:hypothetical protein
MAKSSDTLARLRARSTEAGRFVLPLEPVWADKLNEAYSALRRADLLPEDQKPAKLAEAQAVVDGLVESAGDNVVIFKLRRLGRAEYDALVTRHPPTPEQRKEDEAKPAGQQRIWNEVTMEPELVALACIDPKLTVAEAAAIIRGEDSEEGGPLLSKGEAEMFLTRAFAVAMSAPRSLPRELDLP